MGPTPTSTTDPSLLQAIEAYDAALHAGDLGAVDALFDEDPATSRFDEQGPVRGPDAISALRRVAMPNGVQGRTLGRHDVRQLADGVAVATLELTRSDGTQGLRTQVWRRTPDGWRITHAHLSSPHAMPFDPGAARSR